MHEKLFPLLQAVDAMLEPVMNSIDMQCHNCPHDDICCTSFVSVTSIEAACIAAFLTERGLWKRYFPLVKKQSRRAPRSYIQFIEDRDNQCLQWFEHKVYCAFYDHTEKRCGIYDVRPLMCRGLFAALGTDCKAGHSQTTNAMVPIIDRALYYSIEITPNPTDVAGELSVMVLQARNRKRT